jgi:hypothetical protein
VSTTPNPTQEPPSGTPTLSPPRYEEIVLGLAVNADTYDEKELPVPDEKKGASFRPVTGDTLSRYDFRLRPSNYAVPLKGDAPSLFSLETVAGWYGGKTLLAQIARRDYIHRSLCAEPVFFKPAREAVLARPPKMMEDYVEHLLPLGAHGIHMRPVHVEGDGSCLVHAVSTALVGSQVSTWQGEGRLARCGDVRCGQHSLVPSCTTRQCATASTASSGTTPSTISRRAW